MIFSNRFSVSSLVLLPFLFAFVAGAQAPAAGDAPAAEPAKTKTKVVQSLDAKINNLQSARNCVTNAKSRGEVDACRKNVPEVRK